MSYRASVLLYSSIVYVGLGITASAIGPLLPDLAHRNGVGLSAAGLVFTGIFLGAVVAQLAAGEIADRVGRRPVFLFGVIVMVLATVGLIESRLFALTIAMAAAWGIGLGAAELAANVLAAELFPGKSVSTLNLLNVFYGVGAFTGPALVSLALGWWHSGMPALAIGAALLVTQAPFLTRLRDQPKVPSAASTEEPSNGRMTEGKGLPFGAPTGAPRRRVVYASPLLWLLGAALLVYVGTEQMVGGWAAVFMERTTELALSSAALVASAFWVAFTVGRAAAAAYGTRIAPRTALTAGLATALAGALLVNIGAGTAWLSIVGFLLIGFGFGPIYPTTLAIAGRSFAGAAGKAIGAVGALGSVGGMIFPLLDGILIGRDGPLAGARFVVLAIVAIVALLVVARTLIARSTGPARAPIAGPQRPRRRAQPLARTPQTPAA